MLLTKTRRGFLQLRGSSKYWGWTVLNFKLNGPFFDNYLGQSKTEQDCQDMKRGISRRAALSALLWAFYLRDLDRRMEAPDVKFFRYMDDILILAPTRWKLKRAIQVLNETFNELKLDKHPDKTSMGRIEKGFDFLGYHFSPEGLTLAQKTIDNFVEKALRLYEQEPPHLRMKRLGEYCHRWVGWAGAKCNPTSCRH
jgi:RNA-directed DNA polymerase